MIIRQKISTVNVTNPEQTTGWKSKDYVLLQNDPIFNAKLFSVYRAQNSLLSEQVAVRVFAEDMVAIRCQGEQLAQQMAFLRRIKHQNVVQELDCFKEGDRWHFVSEYCGEGSLASRLQQSGAMGQTEAKNYIIGILKGLNYLNRQRIILKELKPSKILLKNSCAKISDFGFDKLFKKNYQESKSEFAYYMSPESYFLQRYEPKSVIWSFGVIMYEMVNGKRPFPACENQAQQALLLMKQVDHSIFSQHISQQLRDVIFSCLTVDVQKRPGIEELKKFKYFAQTFQNQPEQAEQQKGENQLHKLASRTSDEFQLSVKQKQTENTEEMYKFEEMDGMSSQYQIKVNTYPSLCFPTKDNDSIQINDEALSTLHHRRIKGMTTLKNSGTFETKTLISTELTEEQILKFIHYCRLIYKSVDLIRKLQIKEERQLIVMQSWLLLLLQSLLAKARECQDLHKTSQTQKLVSVIQGYLKKYSSEFTNVGNYRVNQSQISYKKMFSYFQSIKQRLLLYVNECQQNQKLVLSHYMVLISYVTYILWDCFNVKDYKAMARLQDLQRLFKVSSGAKNLRSLEKLVKECTP